MVLGADRTLIGEVEQTNASHEDRPSLADCLIISHSPVPDDVIREFTKSEVPPKGYVLVRWTKEELGRSLVAEADLIVINRSFGLGDNVKKHTSDAMVGVVASVQERFILEPIWNPSGQHGPVDFRGEPPQIHPKLPPEISHQSSQQLLYDVPGAELVRASDIQPQDHVIYGFWFGEVQDIDTEVVLLLEDDSIVLVDTFLGLEIVVPDTEKPLVCTPSQASYLSGLEVPAHIRQRMLLTMMPEDLQCGQYVVTHRDNLKDGRWIRGSFSPQMAPVGRVLAVLTRSVEVSWLCPNAFAEPNDGMNRPPTTVYPYENISSFHSTRSLRRNKKLIFYDHDNRPGESSKLDTTILGQSEFSIGNHVKFRDVAGAKRYSVDHHDSGQQGNVLSTTYHGFDIEEFVIVTGIQEVTVLWQNGSRTVEKSTSLHPHTLPETELSPGDYVISKEELFQLGHGQPDSAKMRYNEIQYLQGNYQLLPQKIGVVQKVDNKERLAQVRWFESPNVRLNEQGNILSSGSRFGNILSDTVEEVSIYTIMSQPALDRRRGDMVLVFPGWLSSSTLESIRNENYVSGSMGPTLLSYFGPSSPEDLYQDLRRIAKDILTHWHPSPPTSPQSSRQRRNHADFVGEIVDLGLDGLITVRLGALPGGRCKDIRVPLERILMVIDSDAEEIDADDYYSDPFDDPAFDPESPLEETFEYEGGEKIGKESDEDMWTTDEDVPTREASGDSDVEMFDVDAFDASTGNRHVVHNCTSIPDSILSPQVGAAAVDTAIDAAKKQPISNSTSNDYPQQAEIPSLRNDSSISSDPPRFNIQTSEPPSDHQYLCSEPSANPKLLRRIQREYKILSGSLPSGIYARTFESRLDLLRVMIIGAKETPYEFAPFVVDLHLSKGFPQSPPQAHFHSWTHGLGRINPNLYEEGKVCLSLLGTWPGKSEGESWTEKSTLLQLILSLSALVLVKEPFYSKQRSPLPMSIFFYKAPAPYGKVLSGQLRDSIFKSYCYAVRALLKSRPPSVCLPGTATAEDSAKM